MWSVGDRDDDGVLSSSRFWQGKGGSRVDVGGGGFWRDKGGLVDFGFDQRVK